MVRGTIVGVVLGLAGVTSALSATAIRGRLAAKNTASPVQVVASAPIARERDSAAVTQRIARSITAPITAPIAQQGDLATRAGASLAPLTPAIPQGETVFPDGVVAFRVDSTVTLSFDMPMMRTRIPEKFERFLRVTLAQVYGAPVDAVLAKLPEGAIASQGDLLYALPTRGIHIPVKDAWKLSVFPEIRPGQDGPLVVRYRVAVVTKD